MRMGTLMLGGILGAAAVLYLQRGNRPMMMSMVSSAGNQLNKALGGAKKMSQNSSEISSKYGNAQTKEAEQASSTQSSGNTSLVNIESIVKNDPALQKEVSEILTDSETVYKV
ncbi:hypothetical protein [Paenibacillus turpanensis]|uniref:hypothetical protein n=1 Tax=Paenibacillus turpanensis TaxID=2689078 RepID=UPI00140C472C|nr:hypothetical protein [Paenibacillus turpanensis]